MTIDPDDPVLAVIFAWSWGLAIAVLWSLLAS